MQWSSVAKGASLLLFVAAAGSLGACSTGHAYGGVDTAQIRLDDDGGAAMPIANSEAHRPGLTSPIAQICAYPGGKQVLDQDLPGLTNRPEYVFFSHMTLKSLQGMSRGQLKDDDLRKVDADLRALP